MNKKLVYQLYKPCVQVIEELARMKLAIIGTGNVDGAVATGHEINLGVQDVNNFKGKHLLDNPNTKVFPITEAVANSEVILLALPHRLLLK